MKFFVFLKRLFIWLCVAAIDIPSFAGDPVNPNATPEARALLDLIYRLAVPLFPPMLTSRLAERMCTIFSFELKETFLALSDYLER